MQALLFNQISDIYQTLHAIDSNGIQFSNDIWNPKANRPFKSKLLIAKIEDPDLKWIFPVSKFSFKIR